jgi:nicotinic acid mononucleotide adenylyltransferase
MTGAFSPIHAGHIIVMKTAKSELEKRGFCVIGGFLSPSHDEYVNLKDGGRAKLDAKYRVSLCKKAVKGSDWLMADGWESQHVTKPINYSVVYRRLKKYLAHKFPTNSQINVCLVVGGDNAAYSRIMSGHGYCVCIDRHNSNLRFKKILEEPGIKANRKIIMVSYKKEYLNYSSSSIRRGNLFMLENKSSEEYKKIKSQK